jgi:hypothetical protein
MIGLGIDLDEVGAATWAIICSEYGEHTLVEHFDPLCRAVEPISNHHCEVQVLGVFNISLEASLEIIFMGFDLGFKSGDTFFEMPLLFNMALLSNSDGADQRGCNPTECNCVNVGLYSKSCSD